MSSVKRTAKVSKVQALNSAFTLVFVWEYDYTAYIDVGKFWPEQVNLREDLFVPPDFHMAMVVVPGEPVREMRLCKVQDLSDAVNKISDYILYNEYIKSSKLDRLKMFCNVLQDVAADGAEGIVHLDVFSSSSWEELGCAN